MTIRAGLGAVAGFGLIGATLVGAPERPDQTPGPLARRAAAAGIFERQCATCHSTEQSGRTPSRFSLALLTPRAVVSALEDGVMRAEGARLSRDQRVAVAEFLTGRPLAADPLPDSAYCSTRGFAPLDLEAISWMGYGGSLEGTGFQAAARAGIDAADVPRLELRWAFAFPGATQARTKPAVIGALALVADQYGVVYALEVATGCVRWTFEADAGIRGAILVGSDAGRRSVAYFVDFRTNAYALDVARGSVLWKTRVGWHPESAATGSPALHAGRLIVPISSMEVVTAQDPRVECCTSSGAVAALDAASGDLAWYHRTIPEDPKPAGQNAAGTRLWAPSGAPVWASPTIDVKRGFVYVGTGENYSRPATASSDAILALDIATGKLAWSFQGTPNDAYTMACGLGGGGGPNCPTPPGPDLDFGMSPMLVTRPDGKEILVVGQKSGVVFALDPDAGGQVLWSTRVGKGSALGGIHWGMATDGRLAYAANADRAAVIVDVNAERALTPGLYALDLMSGRVVWSAPAPADTCAGKRGCFVASSAAPTAIPGVVFAGGLDGHIRAHAAADGRVLWDFDTARAFKTVNGVEGRGGAIDGPGPVVAGGLVFVNSGYGQFGQMPGNVLLAFGAGQR